MATLEEALVKEKDKLKSIWKMNCEQLAAYDQEITAKDTEIAHLKSRLAVVPTGRPLDPIAAGFIPTTQRSSPLPEVSDMAVCRRTGKAPPVDPFTGDNSDIRFEDWLPSLEEKLIQLAGHLRGKALQEWNLLADKDKRTVERAVDKLTAALGPGSRVMAAQDFHHTLQEEAENVSNYIRRLERAFGVAHGSDKLDPESRSIFLFTQMQDGLQQDLMRSPSVSGTLSYSELCVAAKNEEKCLVELKKRQQYKQVEKQQSSSTQASKKTGNPWKAPSSVGPCKQAVKERINPKTARCHNCGQLGHFQRKKTESHGSNKASTK